ncbi:hypothetical protein A0H81_02734 [Grifola frondosa]|uniref:Secreted protein n=1 Tax=Grifola frondosa TaxID=5627 RepID=A0A1C7MLS0_GRIFR|nr:hypothetical protein A0H81_02734 [Grifola frondosa]
MGMVRRAILYSYIFSLCSASPALQSDHHPCTRCMDLGDANRHDGTNRCTLWEAFASRSLGVNENHNDDSTIPDNC